MRRILDHLILLLSCASGLVAVGGEAAASEPPYYQRSGPTGEIPLLGGLAALGFYWLWRRLRRPDRE